MAINIKSIPGTTKQIIASNNGQSIFDLVLERYGTIESMFDFFALNPDVDLETDPASGQQFIIDVDNKGESTIKQTFSEKTYITNNADFGYLPDESTKIFQSGEDVIFMDGNNYDFN